MALVTICKPHLSGGVQTESGVDIEALRCETDRQIGEISAIVIYLYPQYEFDRKACWGIVTFESFADYEDPFDIELCQGRKRMILRKVHLNMGESEVFELGKDIKFVAEELVICNATM